MNATFSLAKIKKIFLGLLSFVLLVSCGSFQSASYFETDGIYVSLKSNSQESSQEVTQDTYYSQYFHDVADGYIPETTQETYFTDTDAYTSSGQNQYNDIDSATSQIPWGGQTSQTEIIVGNNGPNYFWGGLSGFAFRTSSFWNNYYGDSFRFGYGNFFNPFFNPYRSNFGFWGNQFFNPYMNPYSAYSNFYSPYGYANFWNVNQRWRRNRFMNGYNNQNLNDRDFASTVARVKSGRGEKNYGDSSDRNNRNDDSKESKSDNRDVQRTINRINVGRGVSSIGRGVSIRTNQLNENIFSSSRSTNSRNTASTSGITGLYRSNTNINKSLQGNSVGRVSLSRNSLGARNNTKTSSPRTLRPVNTRRPVVVNNRQSAVRRTAQQLTKGAKNSYSRTKKNNSSPARSYNPTPARSYNSSPARSYNSGSSSRGSSSGASSGGSGRSSSGGRRN
jgi:hypothetical protein